MNLGVRLQVQTGFKHDRSHVSNVDVRLSVARTAAEVDGDGFLRLHLVLPQEVCALVSDLLEDLGVVLDLVEVVGLNDPVDFRQVLGHLGGLLLEVVGGHVLLDLLVEVEVHEVVDHGVLEGAEAVLETAG